MSLLITVGGGTASASFERTPGIIQPSGSYQHAQYRLWSAQFWRVSHRIPVHQHGEVTHPFRATGAIDCGRGQGGSVWYLGGIFGAPSDTTVDRSCSVPDDKILFMPLYN